MCAVFAYITQATGTGTTSGSARSAVRTGSWSVHDGTHSA